MSDDVSGKDDAVFFLRATPVLRTNDYARARGFYHDALGFEIVEEGGSPPHFGIFQRGGSIVFVNGWEGAPPALPRGWHAYMHVQGLAALYAQFVAAGVEVSRPISETVYGMREFEVIDLDGNVLCFGEDVAGVGAQQP